MDSNEQQELREVLIKWYGPQAQHWTMTDEVLNVVIEMIKEMRSCTAVMVFVPEPVTFGNALTQLAKSAITRFIKQLVSDPQVYKVCGGRVLLNFKTKVAMAGMGI